jgi:hypothetical protein
MKPFLPFALSAVVIVAAALPAWADINADMITAAFRGDRTAIRALHARGGALMSRDENGYTPLHWAAYNGDLRMLKLLLDMGAPVDPVDAKGSTPLMLAAWNGFAPCVKILLQRGANRELSTPQGFKAADFARARHQTAAIRELGSLAVVRHPAPATPSPQRPIATLAPVAARPTPMILPTPLPITNEEPTSEPTPEPTPESTRTPEDETGATPQPTAAPVGPPSNMFTLVAGIHLSKIDFPIVGVHYRRTLYGPLALQIGYETGGYQQPVGSGTVDFNYSRYHGALVTTGWLYGGLGATHTVLGTIYSSGFNPAATSYEAIGGLRLPLSIFSFNLEGRFGYDGPSTATLGASASF